MVSLEYTFPRLDYLKKRLRKRSDCSDAYPGLSGHTAEANGSTCRGGSPGQAIRKTRHMVAEAEENALFAEIGPETRTLRDLICDPWDDVFFPYP